MPTLSSILSGSFVGPQGTQGLQGLQGNINFQGTQGRQGLQGLQGLGIQGTQGIQGILNTSQGTQGLQGLQGSLGLTGSSTTVSQLIKTAPYILLSSDSGKHISTNSNVEVPSGVLSVGDVVTIFNNSSLSITIVEGSNVTLYKSGTENIGNRTLSPYGLCTILCVDSTVNNNKFVIAGVILT